MKHNAFIGLLYVLAFVLLSSCHHRCHCCMKMEGRMELILRMPADFLFYKANVKSGEYDTGSSQKFTWSVAGKSLRTVAEIYESGSVKSVARKVFNPVEAADGGYVISFDLPEGIYDIYLWTDFAEQSDPTADYLYDTSDLRSVSVGVNPYRNVASGKEAAFAVVSGLRHSLKGTLQAVCLQWPLARYRLITTDVQRYNDRRKTDSRNLPAVEDLRFEVCYEYFFPVSFNLAAASTNDSASGIRFTSSARDVEDSPPDVAQVLAGDAVFASDADNFLSLTLIVRGPDGNEISRQSGIRVDYRSGFLTTVSGNFLTAGDNGGGIEINTDWEEDIVIRF